DRGDVHGPRMRRRAAGVGDDRPADRVGEPRLHRGALVRAREGGQDDTAGANVLQVALDDLGLVPLRAPPEVAAHRVDRLEAGARGELGGTPPVLVRVGRPGEIDPAVRHRAYSTAVADESGSMEFVALGHAGSEHYAGLETFPNPGVATVSMASD